MMYYPRAGIGRFLAVYSLTSILMTETTETILSSNSKSFPVCVFINKERAFFFSSVSSESEPIFTSKVVFKS